MTVVNIVNLNLLRNIKKKIKFRKIFFKKVKFIKGFIFLMYKELL